MINFIKINDIEEMMLCKHEVDKRLIENGDAEEKMSIDEFYTFATSRMDIFFCVVKNALRTLSYSYKNIGDDYYFFITDEIDEVTNKFKENVDNIIENNLKEIDVNEIVNYTEYLNIENTYYCIES